MYKTLTHFKSFTGRGISHNFIDWGEPVQHFHSLRITGGGHYHEFQGFKIVYEESLPYPIYVDEGKKGI